jgi:ABC-type nickel/cobalt efflux system permease component RcnA
MLDTGMLIDEGLEYLAAFPSAKEKRLTAFLWQTIENHDWGYGLIAKLSGREVSGSAAAWWFWIGSDVIVLWFAAWIFLAPLVLLRNTLVAPTYRRRIRTAVSRCLR